MDKTRAIVAVAAVFVVGAGVGVAAFSGLLPGIGGSTPQVTPPTPAETSETGNATFAFSVVNVSQCGQVCRLMNTTTTNLLDRTARNVTLHVRIFADDQRVWRGTTRIGDMEPGESVRSTTRIRVGPAGALAVQRNGGNVTYVTTVRANNASQQFQGRSNVN